MANMLTKKEFVSKVAEELGVKRYEAEAVINVVFAAVAAAVKEGKSVRIPDIGTLKMVEREEREFRVPNDTRTVTVPRSKKVALVSRYTPVEDAE